MTVAAPLLTRRAVLQVAMESTYRTEASIGANDALYVEEPDYSVDVNLLERNFARDDISPLANIVGRRTASLKFTTELKGNGAQHSGVAGDAPLIARLFRASGYLRGEPGRFNSVSWFPDASWLPERESAEACPLRWLPCRQLSEGWQEANRPPSSDCM